MTWAMWGRLPAGGLGKRDPQRPYATGGLGAAVFIVVPGPDGSLIVLYGSPVLEYIEEIVTDAVLLDGIHFGEADLTWVKALQSVATLVTVNSQRDAQLIFAETNEVGLWLVSGDWAAQAVAMVITSALTGAEVPSGDGELEFIQRSAGDMSGAFLSDTDATLYAGTVLSSQES